MNLHHLIVALIFLAISIVYSMAGQGGASAYLAILALIDVPYKSMPAIALSCNIAATISIVYLFHKAGHFRFRLVVPFLITSLPASFIGGMLSIDASLFKTLLMLVLVAVALLMFFRRRDDDSGALPSIKRAYIVGPSIGIPLGLLAGTIGIGGGVFLLPIIVFLGWGGTKEGAAASGFFTLINSISGLVGHGIGGTIDLGLLIPLAVAVIIGSQIGARLGSKKLRASVIEKVFALLLFGVAVKLLLEVV